MTDGTSEIGKRRSSGVLAPGRATIRLGQRPTTRPVEGVSAKVAADPWGRLGQVSAVAALGLLVVSAADTAARFDAGWGEAAFWGGLLLLFVPSATRLALPGTPRLERVGCVVLVCVGLYLVKVLHAPDQFVFGDEFAHWRTAEDILATGHLFADNPLSTVSPLYPGLEIVTTALVSATGLSIHAAGLIVVGVARLILGLALFLTVERITRSARIAGLAALLYAGNPNFVFWSGQFAYESVSLPIAIFVLYLAVRRAGSREARWRFDVALVLAVLALVMIHHLTAYATAALLVVWLTVSFALRRFAHRIPWLRMADADAFPPPMGASVVLIVWGAIWLFAFAPATFAYLDPVVGGAMHNVLQIAIGERSIKPFFRGDPSLVSPVWERLTAFGAVGVIAASLAVSLVLWARRLRAWPRHRAGSIVITFALAGLLYFPIQALRVAQGSTEISNRSGEFLFLPIGVLCAWAVNHYWLGRRAGPGRAASVVALATVIFAGGVIIGMPRWARMPGPYLVTGDTRAIQDESLALGPWFSGTLGPGNRVVADQTNQLVLGSYGGQETLHGLSFIYFSPVLDNDVLNAISAAQLQYVVVDRRMTSMLPVVGYYYEVGEPGGGHHTEPITSAQLDKLAQLPGARQVFDSGDIVIYAVGG